MPKESSHRFCYPPGTFQSTDLCYQLNYMRSNYPSHPHSDGHGGNHNRPHYQNFGARPKTLPNGRSSYHSGSQSYHQQQPRHSGVSGPRNKPRPPPSLAQYNISHRTVIVNHSSTDPDASSAPSSIAAIKELNDDSHLNSTDKDLVSLHEEPITVEPKFKDASTMTTVYYSRNRSDLDSHCSNGVLRNLTKGCFYTNEFPRS